MVQPTTVNSVLQDHDQRLAALETKMNSLVGDVAEIKQNSQTIVDIVSAGKTTATYVRRYAIPVATFLAGAGLLNGNLLHLVQQIFGGN